MNTIRYKNYFISYGDRQWVQLSWLTLLSFLILVGCAHKQANELYTQDTIGTQVDVGLEASTEKGDRVKRILFMGSSSMAAAGGQNNLVAAMLRAQGWQVETDKIYGPGLTVVRLMRHNAGLALTTHERKLEAIKQEDGGRQAYQEMKKQIYDFVEQFEGVFDRKIAQGHWDYVVLDAHPRWGTPEEFNQRLDEAIFKIRNTNPQAKIILYIIEKSLKDSMDEAEKAAYRDLAFKAAVRNDVLAVPKDELRKTAHALRPDLNIYRSPTDHHDGIDGAYLTACGLYMMLTGKTPLGLPNRFVIPASYDFHQGEEEAEFFVDPETAQLLQRIARDVGRDYLKRLQEIDT